MKFIRLLFLASMIFAKEEEIHKKVKTDMGTINDNVDES